MNKLGRFLVLLLLLIVIVGAGFYVRSMILTKRNSEQASQTISESIASSTDNLLAGADSNYKLDLPNATTTIPSAWKSYTNVKLGYSVSYPSNLLVSTANDTLTLTFPKERYFHWPLQDDVTLSITAGTSCSPMTISTGPFTATTTFSLNGYSFTATEGDDAGAGNRYQEVTYETEVNDKCYKFDLNDHGVNGAGFYVEGQALIQKYDDQHAADMKAVISVFNSIVSSLSFQTTDVVQ